MSLNWRYLTDYCDRSLCGNYSVVKIGGARGWTYEAAYHREQLAVGFQTQEAAKEHCESHFSQHAAKVA